MPQHPTHPFAGPRSPDRATTAGSPGAGSSGSAASVHPLVGRRYRERLAALRFRAPETLRARIRRELAAAREAVER
jgi:hypothetical protein